jgi:hypothetical protein
MTISVPSVAAALVAVGVAPQRQAALHATSGDKPRGYIRKPIQQM